MIQICDMSLHQNLDLQMLIIEKIIYLIKLEFKKDRMDRKKYFVTTEEEPLFDAADVLRLEKI